MDDLEKLKELAGITGKETVEDNLGQRASDAHQKRITEREQNIKPGTNEWFNLWFSQKQQLNLPTGFRGRTKKR